MRNRGNGRKRFDSFLAILCSFVLAVGLLPLAAYAEAGESSGLQAATTELSSQLQAATEGLTVGTEAIDHSNYLQLSSIEGMGSDTGYVTGNATDGYTIYVRDGDTANFKLSVKNTSGKYVELVSMTDSSTYQDGDTTVKPFTFPPFSAYEDAGARVQNAQWDKDSVYKSNTVTWTYAGYNIIAGDTATFAMKISAAGLTANTYDYYVQLGRKHSVYKQVVDGRYTNWEATGEVGVDEVYSARIPIRVVVYNQPNAAVAVGELESDEWSDFKTKYSQTEPLNLGTYDLSGSDASLEGSRTVAVANMGNAGETVDLHHTTTDIQAALDFYADDSMSPLTMGIGWNNWHWTILNPPTSSIAPRGGTTTADLSFNAMGFIAGTYTGKLTVGTIPHMLTVNGQAGNTGGTYFFPVKITLTGVNPRLPVRPDDFEAQAGNGAVELTWTAPDENTSEYTVYTVYRRDGEEAQTDPDQLDWSNYTEVGTVTKGTNTHLTFADGTVENGHTYTYTVIAGLPKMGYAAAPKTSTPSSTAQVKLLAPQSGSGDDYVTAMEGENGVQVSWCMNSAYGGSNNDGTGMVDHFNVYRDGMLVKQIAQSAVSDYMNTQGGVDTHNYGWSCFVSVPQPYVKYSWNVAAVSKSGVEGYRSGDGEYGNNRAQGYTLDKPFISGHDTYYDDGYHDPEYPESDEPAVMNIDINGYLGTNPNLNACTLKFWKRAGAARPDTSGAPYATVRVNAWSTDPDYQDFNVTMGQTYTYVVCAVDSEGVSSDPYQFTVKATKPKYVRDPDDGWEYLDYCYYHSRADVTWFVANGTTPTMRFEVPDGTTARVYRNNTLQATYAAGGWYTYTNTPTSDGTYTYRVDYTTDGITATGREYQFLRDTTGSTATITQVPGAPTLTARISNSAVVLRWEASDQGGAPEGYHVYRKDQGEFVLGNYAKENGYSQKWGNNRYLTIQDASETSLVDPTQSGAYYKGNAHLGIFKGLSWSSQYCPREYWVTAYNEAGESEPSPVVVYEYQGVDGNNNPIPPSNEDEAVPGTPRINNVWVEWDDTSTMNSWDEVVGGQIYVAWDDIKPSSDVDRWQVAFSNMYASVPSEDHRTKTSTLEYAEAVGNPTATQGGIAFDAGSFGTSEQTWMEDDKYKRTITVSVTAENGRGSSKTASKDLIVTSLPRFAVAPENGAAKLAWTDILNDTEVVVNNWEVWRKDTFGLWQRITSIPAAGLQYAHTKGGYSSDADYYSYTDQSLSNGYEYEYKVIAKCADGIDRPSAAKKVTPYARATTEAPGSPTNLRASVVNGEISLAWDPPTEGGAPQYYRVFYSSTTKDLGQWSAIRGDVCSPSTSATVSLDAGTYHFFVLAYSRVDGSNLPNILSDYSSFETYYPTASNIETITITPNQANARANWYPDSPTVTATPGDSRITLSWPAADKATWYEVERYTDSYLYEGAGDVNVTIAAVAGQGSYSYTDTTAEPGVHYWYKVTSYNNAKGSYSVADAIATGKTRDQVAAESVSALIDALPAAANLTLSDVEQVYAVQDIWETLTAKQQGLVTAARSQKLAACVQKADDLRILLEYSEVANEVQAKIDALPAANVVTSADQEQIQEARSAYDALSVDAKKLINAAKLIAVENALAAYPVSQAIAALDTGADVTVEDEDAITAARAAYKNLNEAQQAYVTNLVKLEAAEAELKDAKAAAAVVSLIGQIPAEITTANLAAAQTKVTAAQNAYDGLTAAQQVRVGAIEYEKIANAQATIDGLRAVANVESLIRELPTAGTATAATLTSDNWKTYRAYIYAAWDAYSDLSDKTKVNADLSTKLTSLKSQVDNFATALINAADAVDTAIGNLPAVASVGTSDATAIGSARAQYNSLDPDAKFYVTKLADLEAREAALVEAQQEELAAQCSLAAGTEYLPKGQTTAIVATKGAASDGLTWAVSDSSIATLIGGQLAGVKASEEPVTITATFTRAGYDNGSGTATLTAEKTVQVYVCSVNVKNPGNVMYQHYKTFKLESVPSTLSYTWTASDNNKFGTEVIEGQTYDKVYVGIEGPQNGMMFGNEMTPDGTKITLTATSTVNPDIKAALDVEVTPISLKSLDLSPTSYTFDGSEHCPEAVVYNIDNYQVNEENYDITWPDDKTSIGVKTVTVTGKNSHGGTLTGTYEIKAIPLTSMKLGPTTTFTYNGRQQRPTKVTVKAGDTELVENQDYKVTWPINMTSVGTKTVTVTGMGNYGGRLTATYKINAAPVTTQTMYRVYNKWSGEHLFTLDKDEYNKLGAIGWKQEGEAWKSPKSGTKVYRLYNRYSGDHHYTTSADEYAALGRIGWTQEGVAFYSGGNRKVYRGFNPYETIGTHHYTTDANEMNAMVRSGWKGEGVGWYCY